MVRSSEPESYILIFTLLCLIWLVSLPNCTGAGEAPYAPQPLSFGSEAKSSGKYGNVHPFSANCYFPLLHA